MLSVYTYTRARTPCDYILHFYFSFFFTFCCYFLNFRCRHKFFCLSPKSKGENALYRQGEFVQLFFTSFWSLHGLVIVNTVERVGSNANWLLNSKYRSAPTIPSSGILCVIFASYSPLSHFVYFHISIFGFLGMFSSYMLLLLYVWTWSVDTVCCNASCVPWWNGIFYWKIIIVFQMPNVWSHKQTIISHRADIHNTIAFFLV